MRKRKGPNRGFIEVVLEENIEGQKTRVNYEANHEEYCVKVSSVENTDGWVI